MATSETSERIQALRRLLKGETSSSQEELRAQLEKLEFVVNQSTISRDLKRLGAIKATDLDGQTVYTLPSALNLPILATNIAGLVHTVEHNGSLVVINTDPGAAPLVARHIDALRLDEILGSIAGDDTIFVAPSSVKKIDRLVKIIEDSLSERD